MKLKQAYATETYVSDSGYYVISQDDGHGSTDVVILSRNQVFMLLNDMNHEYNFNECLSDIQSEED